MLISACTVTSNRHDLTYNRQPAMLLQQTSMPSELPILGLDNQSGKETSKSRGPGTKGAGGAAALPIFCLGWAVTNKYYIHEVYSACGHSTLQGRDEKNI